MKVSLLVFSFVLVVVSIPVTADITTREITYESNDVLLTGYLAQDDAASDLPRPLVLVVHEWWGHNAYARKRAEMLAEMGYVAFALDMYGDGKVADHPDDAKKFMQEATSNQQALQERFYAAMEYVKDHANIDESKIVAIGYCFGGGVVLNLARAGADLKAVVSFHGSLSTNSPAKQGEVTARVIVFHGGNDAFIPQEQVEKFEDEMQAAGVDYELIVYEGVDHSFTNPDADDFAERYSMPLSYDEEADFDSWGKMEKYLQEMFSDE